MNKIEFLNYLKKRLRWLGNDNAEDAVHYYKEIIEEKISEGMSEKLAVESLGNPKQIASNIAADIVENKKIKNPSRGINLIMGALLLSPILFPMALVALILYIVVIVLWVAFSLGFGGAAIASLASIITTLSSPIDIGSKFILLGISLVTTAVFVLLCILVTRLGLKLIDLITVKLVRKIRVKTKNEEKW